ncbi:hypothetical protein [Ottowia cancrivicina]|uniref:Uncharacterized protein n=1 Tax=Ottowia cancrivicina TaxID=3040346 RepID=A0AAW6RE02_9BURK|nr:hypothetical protein [Ottowia sp. 10c7w1]MDG9698369.1 hypothetical protein [Ottowia sp. 10c7w1]
MGTLLFKRKRRILSARRCGARRQNRLENASKTAVKAAGISICFMKQIIDGAFIEQSGAFSVSGKSFPGFRERPSAKDSREETAGSCGKQAGGRKNASPGGIFQSKAEFLMAAQWRRK